MRGLQTHGRAFGPFLDTLTVRLAPLLLAAACSAGSAASDTANPGAVETESGPDEVAADRVEPLVCPPPGPYGTKLGDTVQDLEFDGEDGSPVTLHGLCGQPLSLVYHFYGW